MHIFYNLQKKKKKKKKKKKIGSIYTFQILVPKQDKSIGKNPKMGLAIFFLGLAKNVKKNLAKTKVKKKKLSKMTEILQCCKSNYFPKIRIQNFNVNYPSDYSKVFFFFFFFSFLKKREKKKNSQKMEGFDGEKGMERGG